VLSWRWLGRDSIGAATTPDLPAVPSYDDAATTPWGVPGSMRDGEVVANTNCPADLAAADSAAWLGDSGDGLGTLTVPSTEDWYDQVPARIPALAGEPGVSIVK